MAADLFARGLRSAPGARLFAVASRSDERARRFAATHGADRAFVGYDALLRDPDVDIVYIATLNSQHCDHACASLDAGKPVLCEKPFTTTADEARAIVSRARERGLFCMEAMWMRFAPAVVDLRRRVRAGDFGEVATVSASLGFRISRDRQRIYDPALGGGALLDLGVYPLSLACALLGAPQRVTARITAGATGVDEEAAVTVEFAGGGQARVATSVRRHLANDAVVTGTAGTVRVHAPLYKPPALSVDSGAAGDEPGPAGRRRFVPGPLRAWLGGGGRRVIRFASAGNGYGEQAVEAMRCLTEGRTESPHMTLAESVAIMEVLDAARAGGGAPGRGS